MHRVPRVPRIHYPGAVYHAMSRGTEGREIFADDTDRLVFLKVLADAKKIHGLRIFAYCLMGNHFHILTQAGDSPLYSGMHHFLTRYSLHFNQRHKHAGHLFQSRYTAPLCRQDSYLRTLLRYIHMNPVRAGLVTNPADWHWSGHNGLVGARIDPILDLDQLAAIRGETLAELRIAYAESTTRSSEDDPGMEYAEGKPEKALRDSPPLPLLAFKTAEDFGLSSEDLCGGRRGRAVSPAKLAFIERALRHGYSLKTIAQTLNCTPAAVTLLRRRKS